jgi:hypothetical protein
MCASLLQAGLLCSRPWRSSLLPTGAPAPVGRGIIHRGLDNHSPAPAARSSPRRKRQMGLPAARGTKLELPPYVIHGGSAPNPILTGDGGGYFLSLPAPAAIAPRLLPSPFVPAVGGLRWTERSGSSEARGEAVKGLALNTDTPRLQ